MDKKHQSKIYTQTIQAMIDHQTKDLRDAIKELPSKDEFFTAMDQLMTEIKTGRQEQTVQKHQIRDHELRITALEP